MSQIKTPLQKYNIRPSKRLGQNFLVDKSVLKKIIAAAELKPDDIILEVGPGLGVLTLELAKHVKKVITIEKDRRMVEIVRNVLADKNVRNVEVIESDILKLKIEEFKPLLCNFKQYCLKLKKIDWSLEIGHWKLVANIPYYLTSFLIRKFLESDAPPELMVLMIQKEVAQRICDRPPRMTLLSVAVQFYAEPKIISYVSKKSFWPQPKVDSAIIEIIPKAAPINWIQLQRSGLIHGLHPRKAAWPPRGFTPDDTNNFFRLVKIGFSQPRKQIINNLSKGLNLNRKKTTKMLRKAGIKPTQRPGELSVDKWVDLAWIVWGK